MQQQRLAFEAAEGSYAEREATLYNALRACPVGAVDRNVASFVLRVFAATAGAAMLEGMTLTYQEIADRTPQGLWCSIDTAKRVVERACHLDLVIRDATRQAGRQAANRYWIGVVNVLRLAGGICSNTDVQIAPPPPQNALAGVQIAHQKIEPLNRLQRSAVKAFARIEGDSERPPAAGGPSRARQCTNEEQESLLPMYQEPRSIGVGTDPACGRLPDLTAALDTLADPGTQKRRLAARIAAVVNDPAMGEYVARAAADLVVFHDLPLADLDKILADVEALRGAGSLLSAGAFFHSKARVLAARHGKPWPKGKGLSSRE